MGKSQVLASLPIRIRFMKAGMKNPTAPASWGGYDDSRNRWGYAMASLISESAGLTWLYLSTRKSKVNS
jgi:hypothetical protein